MRFRTILCTINTLEVEPSSTLLPSHVTPFIAVSRVRACDLSRMHTSTAIVSVACHQSCHYVIMSCWNQSCHRVSMSCCHSLCHVALSHVYCELYLKTITPSLWLCTYWAVRRFDPQATDYDKGADPAKAQVA